MQSQSALFDELRSKLGKADSLHPAQSDPIYYAVYDPVQALALRKQIPIWVAALRNDGWNIQVVSAGTLLWETINESGRYDSWVEVEGDFAQSEINNAVRECLCYQNRLVERIANLVTQDKPDSAVFIMDIELLHPFFRTRAIESALHDRVKIPTVFFYPGRRTGQYGLHFLGFYAEDGNYRSTIIGGDL
ncbi:MAG: BREX protein BrxB domain-containing protein [Armatimonadota bacterium]|nr:DUF1788 domain-containing protein [bacterium]